MSRIWARFTALFSKKTFAGMDKSGNRYFIKNEEIDGFMKEKRLVKFKKESDPTSIPVEWISWLNGQRKQAPTPEEEALFEERREQVRQNVARLKKEEEERKLKQSTTHKPISSAKVAGPDLKSFIQQLNVDSEGNKTSEESESVSSLRETTTTESEKEEKTSFRAKEQPQLSESEPTGSGASYKPGTWQPPT